MPGRTGIGGGLRVMQSGCAAIRTHVAATPDAEALTYVTDLDAADGARTWTYRELDERARAIAVALGSRVEQGSRVLLLFPSGAAGVHAFVGCLYAGMIAVLAPALGRFRHERNRIRTIVSSAQVTLVLTDPAGVSAVEEWIREQGLVGLSVLPVGDGPDEPGDGITVRPDDWVEPALSPDTTVLLQYTSGSTADPRGVVISHGNLLANVAETIDLLGLPERPRVGGWGPLYHDMGLMGQVTPPLFLGGASILMNPMAFLKRPHHWLRLIDRHNLYSSSAPNFAYELCTRRIDDAQLAELDLSRWRLAVNGSEPIHTPTLRAFTERFSDVGFRADAMTPCYGLAEATLLVSGTGRQRYTTCRVDADALSRHVFAPADPHDDGNPEVASCGSVSETAVCIADPATLTPLHAGRIGEILLRGPSVGGGYWRDPQETALAFGCTTTDGLGPWLRTGDLGVLHNGELYVTGRIKEMLVVNGRNLYPQDIEQELRAQHPQLVGLAGAVFDVQRASTGSTVVAVHEIRGRHSDEELQALTSAMKQTVSREFGAPLMAVLLVRPGSVLRTTSGKVQRRGMRSAFLADELTAVWANLAPPSERATTT